MDINFPTVFRISRTKAESVLLLGCLTMEGSQFFSTEKTVTELSNDSLWQWTAAFALCLSLENQSLKSQVESLSTELQEIRKKTEELEARLNQNSKNSNKPPSSDSPYKKKPAREGGEGKPGARKGHPGHRQELLEPTRTQPVMPEECPCGGTEFCDIAPFHTHQQIELPPIEMDVTHFILHLGYCTRCGRLIKAGIPKGCESGYGPRLTAFIAETSTGNSRGWVQSLCQSVFGFRISRGGIQKVIDRVSCAIKPYYEAIARVARQAKVNFMDETPWFQSGILMWLWVMVSGDVTFYKILTSRSKAAFEAMVETWAGVLVSDGYGVYIKWVNDRQSCLAHLMRRAKGLSQRTDPELSSFGTKVLSELARLNSWAHAPPTKGEASMWYARLVHLISRYQGRKDEAGRLAKHLQREMGNLWVFLLVEGVEPTNNRAERALRFAVLWRKMMQGTSSEKGDRWVERILSLRETCRIKGKSTFGVLVEAVTCHFFGQAPDLSWIERSE